MKTFCNALFLVILSFSLAECKNESKPNDIISAKNEVRYAKGFSIQNYNGYSVVKVKNPWPKATKTYTYILKEKNGIVPDSLKQNTIIPVPIKTIVVTSTTHIPSLELLDEVNTLIGFPHCDYISSEKVRARIDAGNIKELGNNQDLNTEVLLDLQPNVIIGYGIDNKNPTLDNLQKSGLKVMLNGDWNEENALGKAEWIKFFGALYGKQKQATALFTKIEKDFLKTNWYTAFKV
jgi:iron complex transport system substrate-binding protein